MAMARPTRPQPPPPPVRMECKDYMSLTIGLIFLLIDWKKDWSMVYIYYM
jgi:hypothetical protein